MPDHSLVGRTYPPADPYEVSRTKIREFAVAIGDRNPLYFDRVAAVQAGYRDVLAPPTFAIVISQPAAKAATFDPELGIDYSRVVHGAQRFIYRRPVTGGRRGHRSHHHQRGTTGRQQPTSLDRDCFAGWRRNSLCRSRHYRRAWIRAMIDTH